MKVRPLEAADDEAYDDLIRSDPDAMVYTTLPWRAFLADAVGGEPTYLVAEADGSLVGAFPSFSLRSGEGTVVNSLPWYGSHGGCTLRNTEDADTRAALLTAFAATLPPDLISCTVVLTPRETSAFDAYAEALGAVADDARVGQVTRLPDAGDDVERELELSFAQKTRNLVRKARKQGFERVVTDDEWAWDFLMTTHDANIRAIGGRPKPRSHFDALRRALPPDWLRVSVALDGTTPAAALLLVRFHRTVEYLTPVIEVDARPRQPLSFLIWEEMLDACRDGFNRWNWGGTWHSQQSLHHFKAGFGAKDRPYRYVVAAGGLGESLAERRTLASSFPFYYVYPYA